MQKTLTKMDTFKFKDNDNEDDASSHTSSQLLRPKHRHSGGSAQNKNFMNLIRLPTTLDGRRMNEIKEEKSNE